VINLVWPLKDACKVKKEFLFEHILDIKVPQKFRGKIVSVLTTITLKDHWWKYDWYWEGASVIVKGS
jgi:hypothetical protein